MGDGSSEGPGQVGVRNTPQTKPLAQRAQELQVEALDEIVRAAAQVERASESLKSAKGLVAENVRVAASLGVERAKLAKAAKLSESTVGTLIGRHRAKKSLQGAPGAAKEA